MRVTHEPINSDLIDMELIELKFIFDRCTLPVRLKTLSHLCMTRSDEVMDGIRFSLTDRLDNGVYVRLKDRVCSFSGRDTEPRSRIESFH